MAALFTRHPLALQTAYSDLKQQALEQQVVLLGTPGSIATRTTSGRAYVYRQFYDALGKKAADYVGPADAPATDARVAELQRAIESTTALLSQARLLATQGYVRAEAQANAVVASLANAGVFRGGGVLVGSHAYGALLNELGLRAAPFRTLDVDVARGERIEVTATLREAFERARVPLEPVPGFDRKSPPVSFRVSGRDGLRFDLLVPTAGSEITIRSVPELDAHATALPHLKWLIESSVESILIGRDSVVPIRIPRAERFAWHKMMLAESRGSTSDKRQKDLHQAAVLFAALVETDEGALVEAFATAPAKTKTRAGAALLLAQLGERAADAMRGILRAKS